MLRFTAQCTPPATHMTVYSTTGFHRTPPRDGVKSMFSSQPCRGNQIDNKHWLPAESHPVQPPPIQHSHFMARALLVATIQFPHARPKLVQKQAKVEEKSGDTTAHCQTPLLATAPSLFNVKQRTN